MCHINSLCRRVAGATYLAAGSHTILVSVVRLTTDGAGSGVGILNGRPTATNGPFLQGVSIGVGHTFPTERIAPVATVARHCQGWGRGRRCQCIIARCIPVGTVRVTFDSVTGANLELISTS